MGMIEAHRIKTAMGYEKIDNFEDFQDLVESAIELVKADFMDFSIDFLSEPEPESESVSKSGHRLRWEMHSCFAYNGIKMMGVIDQYECVVFDRIEGWFGELGIEYTVTPKVTGCMMHTEGNCYREYRLKF